MATLYEIMSEIENFEYKFDEETGEMLNAIQLDELEMAKTEKIENCCLFIKNLLADAEAYKREKEAFAEKQRRAEKKAEGITDYVAYCLQGETYKSDKVQVSYRKSVSVAVDDISKVDDEYLKYALPTVDKARVKKMLQNGEAVEGCHLEEKQNMSIK